IREGKMVVVCDDADRENEGDLTIAAQFVTSEAINFMAKEGRGLICLSLSPERCDELGLDLMAAKNESSFETPFTVSIESHEGVRPRTRRVLRPPRAAHGDGGRPDRLPSPARSADRARRLDAPADGLRRVRSGRLPLADRRQAPRRPRQGRRRGTPRRARAG